MKNQSKALNKLIELADVGLVTLLFTEENNGTNIISVRLEEYDKKGKYINGSEQEDDKDI